MESEKKITDKFAYMIEVDAIFHTNDDECLDNPYLKRMKFFPFDLRRVWESENGTAVIVFSGGDTHEVNISYDEFFEKFKVNTIKI